jgi:hypothetical protein
VIKSATVLLTNFCAQGLTRMEDGGTAFEWGIGFVPVERSNAVAG